MENSAFSQIRIPFEATDKDILRAIVFHWRILGEPSRFADFQYNTAEFRLIRDQNARKRLRELFYWLGSEPDWLERLLFLSFRLRHVAT